MQFTFIIPHKNTPILLERCLNSIPEREDIEIIIVDDCSDSSIVDFNNFPGLNRCNTNCIFLEQSRGAGYARNVGIEQSKGKWLLFADADDFYTRSIDNFLEKYKNNDVLDVVYLNAQTYYECDGHIEQMSYSRYFQRYNKQLFYSEKVVRYNIWTPWTRMVKRDLVIENNIKYDEIPVGNDQMFSLLVSKYAKSIDIEQDIIYNYFVPTTGSVTYAYSNNINTISQRLELQYRINTLYDDVHYFFKRSYIYTYLRGNIRDKRLKYLYKTFFKSHSISVLEDLFNMLVLIIGKCFKII